MPCDRPFLQVCLYLFCGRCLLPQSQRKPFRKILKKTMMQQCRTTLRLRRVLPIKTIPQQKKQKEHKQMLENLTRGDRVVTAGGLYGRMVEAKEDVLTLDLGNDMHVQVGRGFISGLIPADGGASKAKDKKK